MKTKARVVSDVYQTALKKNDLGYIDGYVQGGDNRPYAVFVREPDGFIDLVSIYLLVADLGERE